MENIHSPSIEEAVLSCALIDPNTWAAMRITPRDFYIQRHAMIAEAIESLINSKINIDIVTVSHQLDSMNMLAEIGGPAYLTRLVSLWGSSLNAIDYADQLRALAARRRMRQAATEIAQLAGDTEKTLPTIISEARQCLDNALNNSRARPGRSIAEALREFDEVIESRRNKDFSLLGLSTGYIDIDHKLDGLQDGWLYLIAARPGNGKTAMLGNLAINVAKQGNKVLFFSVEMNDQRILSRMVAAEMNINSDRLKHAALETEEQWSKYYQTITHFESLPMRLYKPDECRSVEQVESITRQLHASGEVDIIFVDYLQLLKVETATRATNREQEVTKIAQTLKRITDLNIPVIAAAQLSRAVEQRAEPRPQLSDLRESGSLEQESDAVCFLFHPDDEPDSSLQFIVAKNRDGALGDCQLYYTKTTQKISAGVKTTISLNP